MTGRRGFIKNLGLLGMVIAGTSVAEAAATPPKENTSKYIPTGKTSLTISADNSDRIR